MLVSIGIDVSKEKLDLGWAVNPSTDKKKTKVFKNQNADLNKVCDWMVKVTGCQPGEILVTVEPTGVYHEALIYHLHDKGFLVFMPNPSLIKSYAESQGIPHKTDKSDAVLLAKYGAQRSEKQALWEAEPLEVRELKAMMRRLDALEKDHQREKNRLEASEISQASSRVIQSLKNMMTVLKQEIKSLEKDIDDHIDQYPPLKKNRELLQSIKGVGPVVSREMVYLFAAKAFKSAKQVASYAGLIPAINESGKHVGKSQLSKKGPTRLRAKLYLASVCAKQHNPCIRAQYQRLLAAGKAKMLALGAAMRKLIQICFGVVKNQQEFQPQPL